MLTLMMIMVGILAIGCLVTLVMGLLSLSPLLVIAVALILLDLGVIKLVFCKKKNKGEE